MSDSLEFIERLGRDRTVAAVHESLQRIAEPYGCGFAAFARLRDEGEGAAISHVGVPQSAAHYFEPDGPWRENPLVALSARLPRPFALHRDDLWRLGAAERATNEEMGGTSKLIFTVPGGGATARWLCVFAGSYARAELGRVMMAARDRLALSMALAAARIAQFGGPGAGEGPPQRLSPRETEVLCHLAAGRRGDAIAWRMGITVSTVDLHVAQAKRKLGAATREQALVNAIRGGLIEP